MFRIQLYTEETELGALNLHAERPSTCDAHIEEIALAHGSPFEFDTRVR